MPAMTNTTTPSLKPCPCGGTPSTLKLSSESPKPKYAMARGDCCDHWEVEFRNAYAELGTKESMTRAAEAWNAAPRGRQS